MYRKEEIKPQIANDIKSFKLFDTIDGEIYCLGSLKKDKYIEVRKDTVVPIETTIKYFTGDLNLSEIEKKLFEDHGIKMDILKLYDILCRANLIEGIDPALVEKQEMDYLSTTLKEMPLNRSYKFIEEINKFIFPYGATLSALIVLIGSIFIIKNFGYFLVSSTYQISDSYILAIIITFIIFIVSIAIHELGHATVGYRFGLRPSKIVFALYLVTPMVYLKMPGIYSLKPKKRIYVWIAGVYCNLMIASIFTIMAEISYGDLRNFCLMVFITNFSLVLVNLSPFLPLDGYFVLSTLLKKPNLRKSSFKEFKNFIFRRKNKFKGISIVYFIASVVIMGGILISQLYLAWKKIKYYFNNGYTTLQIISKFKFVFIIVGVIIAKKVMELVIKKYKINKKISNRMETY